MPTALSTRSPLRISLWLPFSPPYWKGGAELAAEKPHTADNHPGAPCAGVVLNRNSGAVLPRQLRGGVDTDSADGFFRSL